MSSEPPQIKETEDKVEIAQVDLETDNTEPDAEINAADQSTVGEEPETTIEEQLEQARTTVKDYWDQIMRLRAENENNRKRAERDVENAHKFAMKNFTEALLPIIDSMEMGMSAADAENATLQSIREGSELTMNMFVQVLEKQGLIQVDPVGEKFDPERHQAISMVEDENAESNTIISVMQKGFLLNDRLVRPAMVVVAK
ncbi:MAG: nucleotide exchange factor GrpE [Gammaproteobacteria bacterium]|nr:nucleotide exchange factor GrpE [Gammaproteobacteria bacterium]